MKNDKSIELDREELIQLVTRVMERVSQPMIATSADRRLLYWNKAFSKLTGYNSKELNDPIISAGLTAPEWHESETKAFEKLQRAGKSQTFQKEYIRKDGTRVPVEVLVYQLGEDNGKADYYIGLITDITERKELEEELQKSESHYRTLVDSAIEGIVVIQDGEIKFVNPVVSIGTGYTIEELQSMSLKQLLCPDNEKVAVESASKAVVPGTLLVIPLLKIRTKTGETRFIESTVTSIIWDNKPANLNLLRDITERKEAEVTLSQSERKYRSILEDIREGYWEVDLAGNFTSFNDAVCRLIGYSENEMAGTNYRAYTSTDDANKVYQTFNQVYRTGEPIRNMHYEIVHKDGSKKFAETSIFPKKNAKGEISGFRGVSHDITERKNMEETLRHSEERYRTILEEMQDAYLEVDLTGNFTFGNDSLHRYLGYSPGELIGTNYRAVTAADDVEMVYQKFNQIYQTGTPINDVAYKFIRKDGSIGYVEIAVSLLRNKEGEIIGFRGVGRDITERTQMEETLRESENKYRSILEQMEEAYYEVDLDGNYTLFNDAMCRQLGYSREEMMGLNYKAYVSPEDITKVFQAFNQVYSTGKPLVAFLERTIRKDGSTLIFETSVSPIRNVKGEITGFKGVGRDVTQRIRMEEALRQSEEKYRTILEDMEETYFELNLDGNFTFFNNALCLYFGYSREELTGMNYRAYVPPEEIEGVAQAYNQVYRTGEPISLFPKQNIRKDGTRVNSEISIAPLRNEKGEIIGFRGVGRDITKRVLTEKALIKSEEKYRSVLEHMEEAYSEVDLTGNFTFFNNALCQHLGYSRAELLGMNYKVYTTPDNVEKVFNAYNQVYKTGEPIKIFAIEETRKDGTHMVAEISVSPLRDETGKIIGFREVSRDITERMKMEEALRRSEERYRTIMDEMHDDYFENDLAGHYTFVNDAFCRSVGFTVEELMGSSYKINHSKDASKIIYDAFNQIYRTGQPIKALTNIFTRKDGSSGIAELSAFPLRNEKGEIIGFRGVSHDVTERKQMEEALRQSEKRYRTILNEMEDNYFEVGLDGNYIFVNDALCHGLGYTFDELIGTSFKSSSTDDDAKRLFKAFHQTYLTGEPTRALIYTFVTKDGSSGIGELSAFPVRNDKGEIIGFRGVSHDVTERKQMEEALRQSEKRYRTILEDMQESYFETDLQGNYTVFNDAQCQQLGYTIEEMMGLSYKDITPPDKVKEVFEIYNRIYRTGEPNELFQAEQIRKDGTRIPVEYSALPIRNEKGEIIGFRGVGRDITERQQAEEALRQSEERYRTVLEDMEEAYYELDLAGNYTLFNNALCRQLGYSREELMGMNYRAYVPPEDVARVFQAFNKIYRTGKPVRSFPMERIRKDGTRVFTETSGFPLRDQKGEIIGFRGVIRDITKRVQMEEALRRSEERYRTLLDEMEEPYYEVDLAGNYTFFNDALCNKLGYSREEMKRVTYKIYTIPDDVNKVLTAYNQVYRTGMPIKWFPSEQIRKDGARVFTETSVFPVRNKEGKIIGFRGVSRDVTERKKSEEEKKQLEQKAQLASRLASVGELASGVAHEINNPLTGVIGYAHLLLARKEISRDVRRDLEIINEGAQRVAGIVKKLLAFARQTRPEQRYVNINELIRNTLDLRAYELAASNIKVILQLLRDMPMTIADPGQLQQVFLNLIINAETEMKLARDGGRLTIKTEKINNTIRITFKDTGPGIAKENLETIFDPFFTTREVGQGTGLGLSVCHGIVTEHNGRIWAESEPGRGATFIVELPLTTQETQSEPPEPVIVDTKKITKAKILVVDDEPVIRQLVSQVLSEQGHTVDTVDNAAGALKMVKSKRYRLILLDIKMPGMSGIELYKQFQKIAPSLTKRIVFITGDVMGKRTTAFLDKTKTPYLMKPFDARELKKQINGIIAKK